MAYAIINPGFGPVLRATKKQAMANMRHFVRQVNVPGLETEDLRSPKGGDEGRYSWCIRLGNRHMVVDMPGVKLTMSRSWKMGEPRIYVDGSSWQWPFAVEIVQEEMVKR